MFGETMLRVSARPDFFFDRRVTLNTNAYKSNNPCYSHEFCLVVCKTRSSSSNDYLVHALQYTVRIE